MKTSFSLPHQNQAQGLIRRCDIVQIPERAILLPLLRLTPLTEGFPWDDLRKILHGGERMDEVRNGHA